ncbi:hypothetical protein F511_01697 [Dorcoceras hygrometricum]|nr:hypothetical protein F511_01697 [Dorcoceras hygrometricum]
MKMPFRLLCDIVAKAISVKVGSFNAITVEKFSLITVVVCGVKMNWAKYLFGILTKMVTAGSKQSRGFAIQVSLLLATFPALRLGESSEFPSSKVLTKKTVHHFVSINDRDGAEEVTAAAKKKAVSKKRPAADVEAAVPKKKRTVKKKSVSSISSLEMVAVEEEAVPIQQVAEPLDVEEPRCSSADAVDLIIQQVIEETRAADAPADIAQQAVTEEKHWFDLPYEDLVAQWEAERPVVTASDTDEDLATADVAPADVVQQVEEFEAQISVEDVLSADEQKSLEDILLAIPVDVPLPSTCMEVDKPLLKSAAVLGMDDPGMVSMFEALMASGLRGFLGCPAIVYEDALVDFFENASVRRGVVISTVGGQLVEISEKLFAETFELPVDGLGDLYEMPKDAIFDARSIVSLSGEPINLSGRKNQMKMPFRLLCDIVAKAISVKVGSFNAITVEKFSLITVVVCGVKMNWAKYLFGILTKMVTAGSKQSRGFAIQVSLLLATFPALRLGESSEFPSSKVLTKKTVHHFVSINDRDGAEEVTAAAKKKAVSKKRPAADVGAAVPKKKRTCKKKSISSISSLVLVEVAEEAIPIQQGNPAKEHYSLICADIDLLVDLRAKVIAEVAQFLHSFSLRKLASINFEEMYKKEEQVLSWGETESPQEAIQRQFYILLKYRTVLVWKFLEAWRANFAPGQGSSAVDIQVIELLSALHLSLLEDLAKEARILGLTWTKPCCSLVFEGSPRDRGAVIARSNSNTRSLCWIRRMLLIDGLCAVEFCADRWVKIPKRIISTKVPLQRQYDDTLPTMSVFFKLLRKRWADLNESVSSFAPTKPTVFAVRVLQFCSVFVNMSLFSWLPSTDISEFLSSIALDKTVLRSFQSSQESFSVAPRVQLALEQQQSSSSSSSSSSSLRFDATDIDATVSSRHPISQDLSAMFADFQATLSEQLFESQSNISSKLHKIEQNTIRFNEFRKNVLAQNASIFVGLADVRKEVQDVNAKVDIMAKRLTDIQKDAEATKEALSHQLLEFQSSAQENHNVIHAQLTVIREDSADGIRFEFYRVLLRMLNDSVLISWNDVVGCTVSFQQMKISADSLLK